MPRFTRLWLPALAALLGVAAAPARSTSAAWAIIDGEIAAHPGLTGVYVLDGGQDALLARAWLADNARESIEVQYFIWSSDNVGILASAALLRAAVRGVKVRVIVDDLLIDAPDASLLALARHPNIDIRIYNPRHTVGTTLPRRLLNIVTDFRGVNQRMHDKTFVVDGKVAITGGRNMADEYFDFDHAYNFRDRDALLVGAAATEVRASFERFWRSELAVPVERRLDGVGLFERKVELTRREVRDTYFHLMRYAADPANFAPEVRSAIASMPTAFPALAQTLRWSRTSFLSDLPGKNASRFALDGGGRSGAALGELLRSARREVLIQSPYLIASDAALDLFRELRQRGVSVRISTNSLASTDNLQAFSGYRNQRAELLALGLEIREFRPNPAHARDVMQRYAALQREAPVFALHAKTVVIDGRATVIGTYNLDPRSENLNTEVGVVIHDATVAADVRIAILADMRPENSWNPVRDDPDRFVPLGKRVQVALWQWLPIKPLL